MKHAPGVQLAQRVTVRGRFHRSVHLPRDFHGARDLTEYFVTPALESIAGQILEELARSRGARAWTLTGPYGAGKSAFALFLADLLASAKPAHEAARALRQKHRPRRKPLLALLVQAERAPLAPALAAALAEVAGPGIAARARRLAKSKNPSGASCAALLSDAAAQSPGGLALVVDELGKYLEHAATGDGEDIFLLQQIAESAARSDKPLLFIGVLHSGFADYVSARAPARRAEWQKIQGRFRDLPFSLPAGQLLELVAHALECKFSDGVARAYERRSKRILRALEMRGARGSDAPAKQLAACLPLHPCAALLLWPLFRSKVAQNERSLFAFLSSHEAHGFQEFLLRETATPRRAPLYGLPELYDYIASALGMAAFTGRDARRWGLIEHALERVPARAPRLAHALVKSIGLLALYGGDAGLRADKKTLGAALDAARDAEFEETLALLERESIVLFRRHQRGYGLWEGSDVDLDAALATARGHRSHEPLHERLARVALRRPLVARAHYIRSGTLRFFETRLAAADAASVAHALDAPTQADGIVLFLLDAGAGRARRASDERFWDERMREFSDACALAKPVLLAAPKGELALGAALDELEDWAWVRENLPELAGDPVARQEVSAREDAARAHFEERAGRTLGLSGHVLDPGASRWFYNGRVLHPTRPRELQQLLSEACERAYAQAPELRNELLNRQNLSAASSGARRNLMARIFHGDALENLGIEKYPPEYGMYHALIKAGGFHKKQRAGGWRLGEPVEPAWKNIWGVIQNFLERTRAVPRPLGELIATLQAPPFGLRAGPLPVLFALLLRTRGAELALYEDGLFVPEVSPETLERLARRPETFALRCYRLSASERRAVAAIGARAQRGAREAKARGAPEELLDIVKRLLQRVSALTPYARRTRSVSEKARELRALLFAASDPRALLLEELPRALGVRLGEKTGAATFANALERALRELEQAYPRVLERVEKQLRKSLGSPLSGEALRAELQTRARALLQHASHPQLKLFLNAMARAEKQTQRDWRAGIALAVADGQPPERWSDEQAVAADARLRALALDLDALSELVAAGGGDATVARIGVRTPDAGARQVVVTCPPEADAALAALLTRWRGEARAQRSDARTQLLALALLAQELTKTQGETQ